MRESAGLTQTELAERIGTTQNGVYRLESPDYGRFTFTTLKRVAAALDVALVVRFVPFSELVDWVSGTPRIERGLRTSALDPAPFDKDKFAEPADRADTAGQTISLLPTGFTAGTVFMCPRPAMLKAPVSRRTTDSYIALEG